MWLAITQIEAQALLLQVAVTQYPHLKAAAQSERHRKWHKMAYPKTHENTEKLTTKELGERLKAALNG